MCNGDAMVGDALSALARPLSLSKGRRKVLFACSTACSIRMGYLSLLDVSNHARTSAAAGNHAAAAEAVGEIQNRIRQPRRTIANELHGRKAVDALLNLALAGCDDTWLFSELCDHADSGTCWNGAANFGPQAPAKMCRSISRLLRSRPMGASSLVLLDDAGPIGGAHRCRRLPRPPRPV